MMNLETIYAMTPDQILILNGLVPVASEAKEMAKLIHQAYTFHIGENKIMVWEDRDGYNREFLTHDGVWQARYLHQTYDIVCTEQEIFKYLQAEYLIDNKFVARVENGILTEAGKLYEVVRYFRGFIRKTQQKLSAKAE